MTDPVEELVAALKAAIGKLAIMENATRSSEVAEVHEQCRRAISRFNAERGKGVWVPREPVTVENASTGVVAQVHEMLIDAYDKGIVTDPKTASSVVKLVRRLAPREPTRKMRRQGGLAYNAIIKSGGTHADGLLAAYRAMIAASEKADT